MRYSSFLPLHTASNSFYYFSQVRLAGRYVYAQKQSNCPSQRRCPLVWKAALFSDRAAFYRMFLQSIYHEKEIEKWKKSLLL